MPQNLQTGCQFAIAQAPTATRALVAYEGTFTSMQGIAKTFSRKLIDIIVQASNKRIGEGHQVPLYFSNHNYDPTQKIGLVEGPFEAKVITEADLPNPAMRDLIGKYGLFAQKVSLLVEEAIARYSVGLLKPVSMGIDFTGRIFPKNAIYELSCVGFGSFPGAQLFSKGFSEMPDFEKMLAEALAVPSTFSVQSHPGVAKEQVLPQLYALFEAYSGALRSLIEEAPDDLDEQLEAHNSDLAVAIAAKLRGSAYSAEAPPEEEQPEEPPPNEEEEDMSRVEDLEAQIKQLKAEKQVGEAYALVSAKANSLFAKGILTPAKLKEFEATGNTTGEILSKFSVGNAPSPAGAIAELNKALIKLEALEEYGVAQKFGTAVANEPLPAETAQKDDEAAKSILTFAMSGPVTL